MSYAASISLAPSNSSDANFRTWGSGVSTAISNMGLVASSDTGQINWATVTAPPAANTSQGYEIWKFNDALQATVPLFLKLEYGSGSATNNPGLWWTIGSGSNGSGTLTGQLNTRVQLSTSTSSTSQQICIFSGDTNRLGMAIFTSLSNAAVPIFLERTKNTDGTDSSLGFMASSFSGTTNRWQQFIPASGSVPAAVSDSNLIAPVGSTAGAFGTDLAVYPALITRGGSYLNAGMTHLGYWAADITTGTTFTMTFYGSTHTFYALGATTSFLAAVSRGNTHSNSFALAMRYE